MAFSDDEIRASFKHQSRQFRTSLMVRTKLENRMGKQRAVLPTTVATSDVTTKSTSIVRTPAPSTD